MNRSLSVDLLLYGGMLFGLSIVAHNLFPLATTLWIDIAGGVISALLGILGLLGGAVRRWATVVLTVLSIALFPQSVIGWLAVKADVEAAKPVAVILTVLWVLAVGQLLNLIQNQHNLLFGPDIENHGPGNDEGGHHGI
jgi:hypothetical protein